MVENDFNRIRCLRCKRFFKDSDRVILDRMNSVLHGRCFIGNEFPMKDMGSYRYIIEKYDFFKELVPDNNWN